MKVGEIFTIERIVMGGTGYRYAPVRLTGEVALLDSEVVPTETEKCGAPEIQRFTFQFLRPGNAEIQLARFRSFELNNVLYEDVLPFHVEPMGGNESVVYGGWSDFAALESEDEDVFKHALDGFVGVSYTPSKVSKQVVNGMNYRFFCYGVTATEIPEKFPAIVKVYVAPGGEAKLVDIQPVKL